MPVATVGREELRAQVNIKSCKSEGFDALQLIQRLTIVGLLLTQSISVEYIRRTTVSSATGLQSQPDPYTSLGLVPGLPGSGDRVAPGGVG